MGAGNLKLVYARWHHLPHVPFRILGYMALVSRDDDNPPTFWGGREALAFALGRIIDPASDDRDREAAFKAVKIGIKALTDRGAITTVEVPRQGRRATYALHLQGDAQSPPKGDAQSPPKGDGERPPEDVKDESGGLNSSATAKVSHAGAREAINEQDQLQQRRYDRAKEMLMRLPDFGESYLARARADLGEDTPMRQLVIHVAHLAEMDAA